MAERNDIPDVKLLLGLYKMNLENTPGIGSVLEEYGLPFIPEAHCYLKIAGERKDFTRSGSDIDRIEQDILEEQEINYDQVARFKVDYHKRYIRNWLEKTKSVFAFEELWNIREKCIQNLSDQP